MRRVLLLAIILLVFLVLLAPVLGPFLVSPRPLEARPDVPPLPAGAFVDIPQAGGRDLQLHYLEAGTGAAGGDGEAPVWLLLHGFTFNAFTWDALLPALGQGGRVLAYDQLPYGLSAKPLRADWGEVNPYTREAALDHLFAFMDAMGAHRAVLVGNSSGGTLALEAALARPERVAGLVLINPWVFIDRPEIPAWFRNTPQMHRLSLALARWMGGQAPLLERSWHRPEAISGHRRELTLSHTRQPGWDLAWGELFLRALASPVNLEPRLSAITQPALVVISDQDRVINPAESQRAAEALPGASAVHLADCGHVAQEECPQAVIEAMQAWTAGLERGGAGPRP